VLEAAESLAYEGPTGPARRLAVGNTNVAAVVTYESIATTLYDAHSLGMIRGLHTALAEQGVALMLLPSLDSPGFAELLAATPVDIVYVLSSFLDIAQARRIAAQRGIALAYLESSGPDAPAPMIQVDDVAPMRALAAHLRDLGHIHVATVTMRYSTFPIAGLVAPVPLHEIANPMTRGRLQGLLEGGLVPEYIFQTSRASREEAIHAVQTLMRMDPRPTAIVCQTDVLAEGVIHGLKELGLDVPGDVSVTGYDGNDIPGLSPHRLTSVDQDAVRKGALFAQIGLALRAGETVSHVPFETHFVKGTTTGPPPVDRDAGARASRSVGHP
jgi:DNA-binding LacI/PurR family transcriptional regulator